MSPHIPIVENLRVSNWQHLSRSERLSALKELEGKFALQEGRNACEVEFIPDNIIFQDQDPERLYGRYIPEHVDENGKLIKETIQINPLHLEESVDKPFTAVETYFHEARHAYQNHIADHPELAESPQQTSDFYKAKHGGYLNSKQYGAYYRCQPTEIDANHKGQSNTAIYYEQFSELDDYLDHMKSSEYEERSQGFAIENIYKDDAREKVEQQYQKAVSREQTNQKETAKDIPPNKSTEIVKAEQNQQETNASAEKEKSEEYDYDYGYGP